MTTEPTDEQPTEPQQSDIADPAGDALPGPTGGSDDDEGKGAASDAVGIDDDDPIDAALVGAPVDEDDDSSPRTESS